MDISIAHLAACYDIQVSPAWFTTHALAIPDTTRLHRYSARNSVNRPAVTAADAADR